MTSSTRKSLSIAALCGVFLLLEGPRTRGASKAINLDARAANSAESAVALDILTTFPPKVQNKVTNRAVGDSYSFNWVSAGPGGFSSRLGTGTTAGVGAQWVWQTSQTIYSFTGSACANDVCFTKIAGPDPAPTNSPAWRVPGRTLVPNAVTPSAGSLTSSLLTFFSPPQLLVEATSVVTPLANGLMAYNTTYTNHTGATVVVESSPAPLGCCPDEGMLNCDGTCVDYQNDPDNCGECGFSCEEYCGETAYCEPTCSYGYCYCDGGEFLVSAGGTSPSETMRSGSSRVFGRNLGVPVARPHGKGKGPEEAPVCIPGQTFEVPAGGSQTTCTAAGFLPKEVSSILTVCGDNVPDGETTCGSADPASSGTFMQFAPDESLPYPYPGIYITPYQVTVTEPSGDGVLSPGETGTVYISVLNAGSDPLLNPVGTLISPDIDLTDDGIDNPTSVVISPASSPYTPDLLGVPTPQPGDSCDDPALQLTPSVNTIAFGVTIPLGHPEDVARPFYLQFNEATLALGTPLVELPISLGVSSVSADLSIGLADATDPAQAGSALDYTVSFANHGPSDAANAKITVTLPAGVGLVGVDTPSGWACGSTTEVVTCTKASFAANSSGSFAVHTQLVACSGTVQRSVAAAIASDTHDEDLDDNTANETTQVVEVAPTVTITQPTADQTGSPPVTLPITIRFTSQAGTSPIVRETVGLESCVIWDGLTYGDRDGLLSDEQTLQTNKYILCQAMARCGFTILSYPRIRVTSTNACGGVGTDDVIIRKRLLKTEVCR